MFQLVKLLELENFTILLWLSRAVVFSCELNLAKDEASINDRIASTQDCLFNVSALHVCVPSNHVFLAFVVHEHLFLFNVLGFGHPHVLPKNWLSSCHPCSRTAQSQKVTITTGCAGSCRLGCWCLFCRSTCCRTSWNISCRLAAICLCLLLRPLLSHRIKLIQPSEIDKVVTALVLLLFERFEAGKGILFLLFRRLQQRVKAANRVRRCNGTRGVGGCGSCAWTRQRRCWLRSGRWCAN
mmetsp:Transcript_103221/g.205155  ORF Transcript_103221/g.205155 Transcript_103221/m.205155 type:complete len:240 (-) Transcript_103221:280-999(-)